MTNPNRTDYAGGEEGLGIIWVQSLIKDKEKLSAESFNRWYEDIHIPDILAAGNGGVVSAWRYKAVDPSRPRPWMGVYKVPDVAFLGSNQFKSIPMSHPMLPGPGPIHQWADFDGRYYKHVQTFEAEGNQKVGRAPLLYSEETEPAEGNSRDIRQWYANEYVPELSKIGGWRRTTLFKLFFRKEDKNDPNSASIIVPKWLALHEFEEGALQGIPELDRIDAALGKTKKLDRSFFKKLSEFGDVNATL